MAELKLPEQFAILHSIFDEHHQPVHLVGGAVRDILVGREPKDLDFVVPDGATEFAFWVADLLGLPAYVLDSERDSARIIAKDRKTMLDFACYRGGDLLADLLARDFTINAMAFQVDKRSAPALVDPSNGQADLDNGKIRMVYPEAIEDDPVRALRAIRLATELGFEMGGVLDLYAVRMAADQLSSASIERVRDELAKMMKSDAPEKAVTGMIDAGLMPAIIPEVSALENTLQTEPHFESALNHTIRVVKCMRKIVNLIEHGNDPEDGWLADVYELVAPYRQELAAYLKQQLGDLVSVGDALVFAALLHDIGKAETRIVGKDGRARFYGHDDVGADLTLHRLGALRFSRKVVKPIYIVVKEHMRVFSLANAPKLKRRSIFRFFRGTDEFGLDVTLVALADSMALAGNGENDSQWECFLETVGQIYLHYFEYGEEIVSPKPILDGREIMSLLEIEPGPKVGYLLSQLTEAQAVGEVETKEDATRLMFKLAGTWK